LIEIIYFAEKVNYSPIIQSQMVSQSRSTCSLHLEKGDTLLLLCNLVRLSRGEMIGVKFNKDKDWVGGTIGLFER
jgi:hypothetical protein